MLSSSSIVSDVSQNQAASGLKLVIIELQSESQSRRSSDTGGARWQVPFYGIKVVQVPAPAISFDLQPSCGCVSFDSQRVIADLIITSNSVAPSTVSSAHGIRLMRNELVTVIATGCSWLLIESMLRSMLHLQTVALHDSLRPQLTEHMLTAEQPSKNSASATLTNIVPRSMRASTEAACNRASRKLSIREDLNVLYSPLM